CAGGVATPADAALVMQLGAEGVFVGSGIFKSENTAGTAAAIVRTTTHFQDPDIIAVVTKGLGAPMRGLEIGKIEERELMAVRGWAEAGRPLYGTCAGALLLARDIGGLDQPLIGVLDIEVERNAFGRQLQSFETDLEVPRLGPEPFHAIFIPAPAIKSVCPDV